MRRFLAIVVVVLITGLMSFGQKRAADRAAHAKAAAATTGGEAASAGLPTATTVEAFMKHMFSYDPGVQWKVLEIAPSEAPNVAIVLVGIKGPQGPQQSVFYVLPGQQWAIAGDLVPFGADPFASVREQLAAKAHGPARGPAISSINLVEFSDLQCPACKAAQPTINRLLQDVPNAHFVFQNFPLDMHPWAFKAAEYADCVHQIKPDAFWKFIDSDYANQGEVNVQNVDQKMQSFAAEAGADSGAVAACVAQPATAARVRESVALGKAVNVPGTPTLFVNGRKVSNLGSVPYDVLKALVEGTPDK